ncbi:MAG TPA: type II toxin-antitoxin system death-on-curing family toxin [Bryobacteraceae bacterium]|nr:type II toxin-antitoxin system death-on-curing family toxin [Bryobacteraceae bacterium]
MTEPVWIDRRDALTLHSRLLALHGGGDGFRDVALLESALARAQQLYAYREAPDVIVMAAAYTAGMVRNHPFVDGNKRTGFVIGILFLELNGYRFTATEADAAQAVIGLASGRLDEAGYAAFLRAHTGAE